MTKKEFIDQVSLKLRHLSRSEVENIVQTIFDKMSSALCAHQRIELRGFGIFEIRNRPARLGRNPKSGEFVQVKNRYVPFFRVGKELKARVNHEVVDLTSGASNHDSAEALSA
jgi:integration host factor subunit beta